jgi:hypothetical protein
MFLKSGLMRTMGVRKLRRMGHDILALRADSKRSIAPVDLSRFDAVIGRLSRFERIRYPDNVLREGMQVLLEILRSPRGGGRPRGPAPRRTPLYKIVLEDVDEALAAIVPASSLNPQVFLAGFSGAAKEYYELDDRHK